MRKITDNLKQHFQQEVTTLATCWKLTLKNGAVLGFTNHPEDIGFNNIIFQAATGFTSSAVSTSLGMAIDNLDIEAILDSEHISEKDIMAGLYDNAEVEVFMVNYQDLLQQSIAIKKGWIGEITLKNGKFIAEIRGLSQKVNKVIGDLYSPTCRAKFCDVKCGLNSKNFTREGSVTEVIDTNSFKDEVRGEGAGYFTRGIIKFKTGLNKGFATEIQEFKEAQITLVLPLPYPLAYNDQYEILAGCDKSFETCKNKFNNAINFRGEPHIAGMDKMFKTAATI